jgi:osmotically-inducible protein OsmY
MDRYGGDYRRWREGGAARRGYGADFGRPRANRPGTDYGYNRGYYDEEFENRESFGVGYDYGGRVPEPGPAPGFGGVGPGSGYGLDYGRGFPGGRPRGARVGGGIVSGGRGFGGGRPDGPDRGQAYGQGGRYEGDFRGRTQRGPAAEWGGGRSGGQGYDAPAAGTRHAGQERPGSGRQDAGRWRQGGGRDDEDIREAVRENLFQDSWVDPRRIEVQVSNGVVTLTGEVRDFMEARYAWDDAWDTEGVHGVINNLTVRTDVPRANAPQAQSTGTGEQAG